jgi:hypothetical protein
MVADELSMEKKIIRQITGKSLSVRKVCKNYAEEFEQRAEVERKEVC